jgi:hypothetical protein
MDAILTLPSSLPEEIDCLWLVAMGGLCGWGGFYGWDGFK